MISIDDQNPWYINRIAIVNIYMAGLVPENNDDYLKKAELFTRASAGADLNNPLFQLNLAYFLHRNGKADEAIGYYKRVIQIDDRMLEARYNIADIYGKKGNHKKRLEHYQAIYEKNPDFPKVRLALASVFIHLDQHDKAIPYLAEEIDKNPNQLEPLKTLASLYLRDKQWRNAVKIYEILLTKYPQERKFHPYYIQSLVNINQVDKALKQLQLFIKANPKDQVAKNQLKALKKALKTK